MNDAEQEAQKAEWERQLAPDELARMLESSKRLGIHLRKCPSQEDQGTKGCWFGGEPTLPESFEWPWFSAFGERQAPMHFLGQIDLASVPNEGALPLPQTGTLFFFFDPMIAPAHDTPPNSGTVIYCPDDVSNVAPRKMPTLPKHHLAEDISYYYTMAPTEGYERWAFNFEPFETWEYELFPNAEFWTAAINLHQNQYKKLDRLTNRDRGRAIVPGYSSHFALHCLGGDASEHRVPGKGEKDLPLLTIASDPDLGFQHGDMISVTFWISLNELENRNFGGAYVSERYR